MTQKLESILESKAIRPTAMRILVLKFLKDQPHAISLNELESGMGNPEACGVCQKKTTDNYFNT